MTESESDKDNFGSVCMRVELVYGVREDLLVKFHKLRWRLFS